MLQNRAPHQHRLNHHLHVPYGPYKVRVALHWRSLSPTFATSDCHTEVVLLHSSSILPFGSSVNHPLCRAFAMERHIPQKSRPKHRPIVKKARIIPPPKARLPTTPPACLVEYVPQAELRLKWELTIALAAIRKSNEEIANFRKVYASLMAPGGFSGWVIHPGISLRPPEPASPSDAE